MVQLAIIFLGTSAATPTKSRGLSSIAIIRDGELLIFDAGEGTQHAIAVAKLGLNRETKIFITHMHGDHCVGLLGIIQSMSMAGRVKPLDVYGPKPLGGFLRDSAKHLRFGVNFPLRVHQVHEGVIHEAGEYKILVAQGEHSSTNFSYVLEENRRRGVFNPAKALKYGVPTGELWSKLQSGKSVRVKNRRVTPGQVLGAERSGRKIGISGDTRPTPKLERFFSNCTLLIFDSTYSERHQHLAKERLHSTAKEAAKIAKGSKSNLLILTHFSSRYREVNSLEAEARQIHPNTIAAYDMMRLIVPYPDQGGAKLFDLSEEQSNR